MLMYSRCRGMPVRPCLSTAGDTSTTEKLLVNKPGEWNAPREAEASRASNKNFAFVARRATNAKLIAVVSLLVVLAACGHSAPSTNPSPSAMPASAVSTTGALEPRGAVLAFIAAVHDQDLQRIAAVWGTKDGSVRETGMSREELERRELVMLCYL